uniref:Serine protease n=1 Tax=Astyanax mexicanus TaxID=7994 RepID=A0A3B1KAP2_ASTMX
MRKITLSLFCKKGSTDIYQINCTSPGTVLESLQKRDAFTELVDNQTFVIEREKSFIHGVIADHFPCHLITEGELLRIYTFKKNEQKTNVKVESTKENYGEAKAAEDAELITFTVETKGRLHKDKKDTDTRNKILKGFNTLCVYAYSRETIEEALKRDGRFDDNVFVDRCKLHELNDKTKIPLNENVGALKGHSYEVCLPRGKPLKSTEKSDTEQKAIVKAESSTVEKKTHKKSKYLKLRKEDFAQSTRAFSTMCQLEKLVNLGTSVCMVKIGNMQGTGFLLFDNFILTNAHVIEESYNIQSKKLTKIMKNEDIPKLPRILKEYTSNQHAGGICIIGHPCFDVKRINVSCIVPHTETRSASGDSILVSFSFLPDHIQSEYQIEGCNIATYSTYFLKGSSGSPVFDEDCKLVAMHTGGFLTDEIREHAIGFAIPLQSIIKNIIKQLASRESLNVMFRFIETAAQNPCLGEYLKECKEYLKGSEKYLKVFAEVLMRNQSDGNAEMLATIYFETKRNGMLNLFQMIQKALYNNKKYPYVQRIQQKIDVSRLFDFLALK